MKLTLLNEYLCCLFDNTGNKIIPDPARVLTENMVTVDGRIRATWRVGLRLENTLKSQCMSLRRWSHPNHWLKARSSAHACFSMKQCSLVPRNCSAGFSSANITWTSKTVIYIGEHHVWSWKTIVLLAGSAFFKRQVYIGGLRLCFSLARQFWSIPWASTLFKWYILITTNSKHETALTPIPKRKLWSLSDIYQISCTQHAYPQQVDAIYQND